MDFFGHSLGGAAAAQACSLDPRCVGAIDGDGDLFGSVLATGLRKPLLFLGPRETLQHEPPLRGEIAEVWRGVPAGPGHVLTAAGTGHFSFTDRAVYVWVISRLGGLDAGAAGGARAVSITRACIGAFFDTYLLGRPSPLLSSPTPTDPEMQAQAVTRA